MHRSILSHGQWDDGFECEHIGDDDVAYTDIVGGIGEVIVEVGWDDWFRRDVFRTSARNGICAGRVEEAFTEACSERGLSRRHGRIADADRFVRRQFFGFGHESEWHGCGVLQPDGNCDVKFDNPNCTTHAGGAVNMFH